MQINQHKHLSHENIDSLIHMGLCHQGRSVTAANLCYRFYSTNQIYDSRLHHNTNWSV